jgi:cytidine deaminase
LDNDTIVPGCNVENVSYGLCLCAERTAVAAAVAAGQRHYKACAVATASSPPSAPCGMCRQVLAEFNEDLAIVLVNPQGERARVTLAELLPAGFDKTLLGSGQDPADETGDGS